MRQIIAMGGGGFSMEEENPLLDQYILRQARKSRPKVCFVPTASGDAEGYIEQFYRCFAKFDCETSHLSLFKPPLSMEAFVLEQDIIYVGGGNTRNLLILWKAWRLDQLLKQAWEKGTILAGLSAGSICWFEQGITDSFPGELTVLDGLGFLKGSHCPHYDGEKDRRPRYHELLKQNKIKDGMAADDGVAIHYLNEKLYQVVSSRPDAKAYCVKNVNGTVKEEVMDPIYLGK